MSLAGAQHKVGLHRRADDDLFLLPEGAASSLIVKPDNARATEFPCCPANEHFCMSLARRIGLAVPPTELLHLPDPIYLVHRFDRVIEADQVRRLHQIDLCQLLNKWAGYKYESDGGITLQQAFAALEHTRQPAVSRGQLLRWLLFNYLIGNSDAHAKNIAFLVSKAGLTLAPAYDLLSVAAYGPAHDFMAMTIADEPRYGWIESTHWTTLGRTIGVSPVFIKKLGHQIASTVPTAARQLLVVEAGSMQPDEQAFVTKIIEAIERHAGYLLESTS
jgi:serine/threonine-protein kinase HipA